MISIPLFCESRYPVNRGAIKKTVEQVLDERGISGDVKISISIVGDRKMRLLNKKYRQKDETTDVLSFSQIEGADERSDGARLLDKRGRNFPSPDNILLLGDIIISFPQARKNASKKESLVDEEIDFLVSHGLLHLLGIHHEE